MIFRFLSREELVGLPQPLDVLRQAPWAPDVINATFLAGKAEEPNHALGPVSDENREPYHLLILHRGPVTTEEKKIIGDISEQLQENSEVILAETGNFQEAEKKARLLGYRPAKPGEYLQILWYLKDKRQINYGWHYCYEGRVPNYAILACFDRAKGDIKEVVFDTYVPDHANMRANAETSCFFVKP